MNKPPSQGTSLPLTPLPVAKTLTEQKSDFTAEGSPPPGQVSTSLPVMPDKPDEDAPASPTPTPERGLGELPHKHQEVHP